MRYFWNAMRRLKQKPPSLYLATSPRDSLPTHHSAVSEWDADDEGFMSSSDSLPSRPISLAIPSGPYCPRRPTLQEVLANSAPPPWTLSAFMAYLSQNHCLETLEFTMDASRYRTHYNAMMEGTHPQSTTSHGDESPKYVTMLWHKLLDAYIAPNGPREVNLPSDVRDHLMHLPCTPLPPKPVELEPAVKIVFELMDQSVLVPFLNSVSVVHGPQSFPSPWASSDEVHMPHHASLDERFLSLRTPINKRDQSPTGSDMSMDVVDSPHTVPAPRHSHHSHLTAALGRSAAGRLSALMNLSTGSSSLDGQDVSLTEDSTSSPSNSTLELMTPPTTPPTSDVNTQGSSPGTSPKYPKSEANGWKKVGAKLGWKKSRSGHGSNSSGTSGTGTKSPVRKEITADEESP